jgi:hypothetical protein
LTGEVDDPAVLAPLVPPHSEYFKIISFPRGTSFVQHFQRNFLKADSKKAWPQIEPLSNRERMLNATQFANNLTNCRSFSSLDGNIGPGYSSRINSNIMGQLAVLDHL